jgi:hypothetical protein
VIGVLTAETITTSSAELINNLALPNEGIAEAIFWIVEDMILVVGDRSSMMRCIRDVGLNDRSREREAEETKEEDMSR